MPAVTLDDLVLRLRRTRYADDFGNDDWTFGLPRSYLTGIVDHWIERFDWRAQERAMNGYANFLVEIDGIPIHFVHDRGHGPAPHAVDPHPRVAVDLRDHERLIGPLSDPARLRWGPQRRLRRGRAVPPGHHVLESVAHHRHRGRDDRRAVAAADDATSWATTTSPPVVATPARSSACRLGPRHADQVIGVHLNFPATVSMGALAAIAREDYTPEEGAWQQQAPPQARGTSAHMAVHIEDPQTLSWAMNDSPAGLAAWLMEASPQLERLRRRRRTQLHQGRAADGCEPVLADRNVPHVGPLLRRVVPWTMAPRARPAAAGHGPDRRRRLPA